MVTIFFNLAYRYEEIRNLSNSGSQENLNGEIIKKIKVLLPPLHEQNAIAQALSDVDSLINGIDALITKKRQIKQGVMQQLLSGKMRLPGFGEKWEIKKLGKVVDFYNGKAHENNIDDSGEYIVVNSKFISTDGKVFKRSNVNLFPLKRNDVAMVMSDIPNGRALAKCFLIEKDDKFALNQRVCTFRSNIMNSAYLYLVLNRNKYFLQFDSGTGQTNLRKHEILECPISIPTIIEQNAIVQVLMDSDREIKLLEERLEKTKALKQGMMQELLTGKTRLV